MDTIESRFWNKVERTDPDHCWEWTGAVSDNGYGRIGAGGKRGKTLQAHRVSYELNTRRPIEQGMTVDHLCRNRSCVNPKHMEVVTRGENVLRGVSPAARAARQAECQRGHSYTPGNLYRTSKGYRQCRACKRMRERGEVVPL